MLTSDLWMYIFVYLAIGVLFTHIFTMYYRSMGIRRVPLRFMLIWPIALVLVVAYVAARVTNQKESDN